jgi:hypothetical protein
MILFELCFAFFSLCEVKLLENVVISNVFEKDSNAMPLFTFIWWIKSYTRVISSSIELGVSSVLYTRIDNLLRISRFH